MNNSDSSIEDNKQEDRKKKLLASLELSKSSEEIKGSPPASPRGDTVGLVPFRQLASGAEHRGHIVGVHYSPDGKYFATCGIDCRLILWDAKTAMCVRVLHDGSEEGDGDKEINSVDFFKNWIVAAYGSAPTIWDYETGEKIMGLESVSGQISEVLFSPDGKYVIGFCKGISLYFWEVATKTVSSVEDANKSDIYCISISSDGRLIATGHIDNSAVIYTMPTPEKPATEIVRLLGHIYALNAVAFSHSGKYFVTGSQDKTARLYQFVGGKWELLHVLSKSSKNSGYVQSLAFSPDETKLLIGHSFGEVRLWNVATGELLMCDRDDDSDARMTYSTFSADSRLVVCAASGVARVYDSKTGAILVSIDHPDMPADKEIEVLFDPKAWRYLHYFSAAALSPNARSLAMIHRGNVMIFDVCGLGSELRFGHHEEEQSFENAKLSPSGKYLAVVSTDCTLKMYGTANGEELHKFSPFNDSFKKIAFAKDESMILGVNQNLLLVWSLPEGALLSRIEHKNSLAHTAAFTEDLKAVMVLDEEQRLYVYDIDLQQKKLELRYEYKTGLSVGLRYIFSQDGNNIAAISVFGHVIYFMKKKWINVLTFPGEDRYLSYVTLVPPESKQALEPSNVESKIKNDSIASKFPIVLMIPNNRIVGKESDLTDKHKTCVVYRMDASCEKGAKEDSYFWITAQPEDKLLPNEQLCYSSLAPKVDVLASTIYNIKTKKVTGVIVWNVQPDRTTTQRFVIRHPLDSWAEIRISPDSAILVAICNSIQHIWDLSTGDLIATRIRHPDAISNLTLCEDRETMVTMSKKLMLVWNIKALQYRPRVADLIPMILHPDYETDASIREHIERLMDRYKGITNLPDKRGKNALHYACEHRRQLLVDMILKKGKVVAFPPTPTGETAIDLCIKYKTRGCLISLLEHVPQLPLHNRDCVTKALPQLIVDYSDLTLDLLNALGMAPSEPEVYEGQATLPAGMIETIQEGSQQAAPNGLWRKLLQPNEQQQVSHTNASTFRAYIGFATVKTPKSKLSPSSPDKSDKELKGDPEELEDDMIPAGGGVAASASVVPIPGLSKWFKNKKENPLMAIRLGNEIALLGTDTLRHVINFKWNRYARSYFLRDMALYFFFLFVFCMLTLTPLIEVSYTDTSVGWLRIVLELILLLLSVFYLYRELHQLAEEKWLYFRGSWNYFEVSLYTLVLLALLFRVLGREEARGFEAVAAVIGWFKTLSFARGFSDTGPFIRLLFRVVESIIFFLCVLAVLVVGFSHAFYLLFHDVPVTAANEDVVAEFASQQSLYTVYFTMLGQGNFDDVQQSQYPWLSSLLLVLFSLFVEVVMLNLLIALLTDIYGKVQENVTNEWLLERLKIIMEIESELYDKDKNEQNFPMFIHVLEPKVDVKKEEPRTIRMLEDLTNVSKQTVAKSDELEEIINKKVKELNEKIAALQTKVDDDMTSIGGRLDLIMTALKIEKTVKPEGPDGQIAKVSDGSGNNAATDSGGSTHTAQMKDD